MKKSLFFLFLATGFTGFIATAQYAPQAPIPGHEGIADTSHLFTDWATGCTFYPGWLDIADKPLGQIPAGMVSDVYGPPDEGLLSLGDSGVAVVTFGHPIKNGPGPDFAVFENGFADISNDTLAFLELAFVEVSSDGTNYVRFPAISAMQDTSQLSSTVGSMFSDARYYHNLAGKYISRYGTPFDLEELKDTPGLDVGNITHVRIVDVVGSIDTLHASRDKNGHVINDPYPTAFPSGGFDLRAIGVINSNTPAAISPLAASLELKLYPNPATDYLLVESNGKENLYYQVNDISGRPLLQGNFRRSTRIDISPLSAGLYFVQLDNGKEQSVSKIRKQ